MNTSYHFRLIKNRTKQNELLCVVGTRALKRNTQAQKGGGKKKDKKRKKERKREEQKKRTEKEERK